MDAMKKITDSLKNSNGLIGDIRITEEANKDGHRLFFVMISKFERKVDSNYSNAATYYAFDNNGNYVGAVIVVVMDRNTVELEYFSEPHFKNKGNITVVTKEVIKDIFENKVFNLLKINDYEKKTNIKNIVLSINKNNYASLAVASKLGFDEYGCLDEKDYVKVYRKRR